MWGISIFVVLSGLSLSLSAASRPGEPARIKARALRLLLPLWVVAGPFLIAGLVLGETTPQELWKVPIWLLGAGAISRETYFPVSAAWWYVSLALQCALLVPYIARRTSKLTLPGLAAVLIAADLAALALIRVLPAQWEYLVEGLIFARLIEIGVGIVAARLIHVRHRWQDVVATVLMLAAGAIAAEALGARTSAMATCVILSLVLGLALVARDGAPSSPTLSLAAATTYPFYLVHAPIGKYSITVLSYQGLRALPCLAGIALGLSICAALAVTFAVNWLQHPESHRKATAGRTDATL